MPLVDTGESYAALQNAGALAAGYLIEYSFSLIQERRIVLGRPRTIIDLAGQLYGSVDDKLDAMIDVNGLSGDEIVELPAGREIVYYV
jgi:hypothetical protein